MSGKPKDGSFEDLPGHSNESRANRIARQMRLQAQQLFEYQSDEAKRDRAKARAKELEEKRKAWKSLEGVQSNPTASAQFFERVKLPLKKACSISSSLPASISKDGFIPFERRALDFEASGARNVCVADAFKTATGTNNVVSVTSLVEQPDITSFKQVQAILTKTNSHFRLHWKKLTIEQVFAASVGTFICVAQGHGGKFKHVMVFFAAQRLLIDRDEEAFVIPPVEAGREAALAIFTSLHYDATGVQVAELKIAPSAAAASASLLGRCKGCHKLEWMSALTKDESASTTYHSACQADVGAPRKKFRRTHLQLVVGDKVTLEHEGKLYDVTVKQLQEKGVMVNYSKGVDEFVKACDIDGRVSLK